MKTLAEFAAYLEKHNAKLRIGAPGSSSVREWVASITNDDTYGSGVETSLEAALAEAVVQFDTYGARCDAAIKTTSQAIAAYKANNSTVTDEEKKP